MAINYKQQVQDPSSAMELLHHVEGLIALGENRANIIAAGNAALLVGYSQTNLREMMYPISGFFGQIWPVACALVAVLFAVASLLPQWKSTRLSRIILLILSFFRNVPLVRGLTTRLVKRAEPRSYFFGCIGDLNEASFVRDYAQRTPNQHVEMLLRAVHMRSQKAKTKFTLLAIATTATAAQFAPALSMLVES